MKFTQQKLADLHKELKEVTKEVVAGKLTHESAAEKIVHLREEIDKIIEHLKGMAKKK